MDYIDRTSMKRRGDRLSGILILLVTVGMVVGMIPLTGSVSAQEVVLVDDDISEDTTWNEGSGPYRIVNSIDVADGATLRIEPGVRIELATNVSVTVHGTLVAEGGPDSPVVFTSSRPEPAPGDWGTIRLEGPFTRVHTLRHVTIEYGTTGITIPGRQGVNLDHVEITQSSRAGIEGGHGGKFARSGRIALQNSVLHKNDHGIRGYDERYTITNTRIADNRKSGVFIENPLNVAEITIEDSTLEGNDIGVNLESRAPSPGVGGEVTTIRLENSTIQENAGIGVRIFGDRLYDIQILESTVRSNGGSGIHLQDAGLGSGSEPSGTIAIRDVRVIDNGNRGLILDGAYSDLEDISVANTVVDGSGADGIWIEADRTLAGLELTGTSAHRNQQRGVLIGGKSVEDVTITDLEVLLNGRDGMVVTGEQTTGVTVGSSVFSANDRIGLQLNGTATGTGSTITDVMVVGNQVGLGLHQHGSRVTDSDIAYNNRTGIRISGSSTVATNISGSNIYENGQGMAFTDGADSQHPDLRNNFWGASSGPTHESINPEGEGNGVSQEIDSQAFIPFAESPYGQLYQPPTPSFTNESLDVAPGNEIEIRASTAGGSEQSVWYRFSFNDSTDSGWTHEPAFNRTFEKPGSYMVNLSVVDEHGIPSVDAASMTITVAEETDSDGSEDKETDGEDNSGGDSGSDDTDDEDESDVRMPGFGFLGPLLAFVVMVAFLVLKLRD